MQLSNAGKFARVHVAATRFLPEKSLLAGLGSFTRFDPAQGTPAKSPNLFAAGRSIGDEYRYILERRYTKLFPGNMLPRPGLLLNPWDKRSTDLQGQHMEAMQRRAGDCGCARRLSQSHGRAPASPGPKSTGVAAWAAGTNLDFLAQSAPVLYNLVPDAKGVVRIDRKALGDRQYLEVYAEDLRSAAWRTVVLAEVPAQFQDLRLVRNLDPQKPFAEKKEATVLATGQTLTLADILTADLETYDSLAGVPCSASDHAERRWESSQIRLDPAMAHPEGGGEAREVFGVCLPRAEFLHLPQRSRLFPKGRPPLSAQ